MRTVSDVEGRGFQEKPTHAHFGTEYALRPLTMESREFSMAVERNAWARRIAILAAALTAILGLSERLAFAQTIILNPNPGVVRIGSDDKPAPTRSQSLLVNYINLDDCNADRAYSVPLSLDRQGNTAVSLQVWAGSSGQDCSVLANRSGTTGTCWRAAPDVPFSTNLSTIVRVRDILRQDRNYQLYTDVAPASVCTAAPRQTIVLFYVWVKNGATGDSISNVTQSFEVRTQGPSPPGAVHAGVGTHKLIVDWTPPSDVTDIAGYDVYCEGAGGDAGLDATTVSPDTGTAADAATDGADDADSDASSDAGTATDATVSACGASPLVAGQAPTANVHRCGTVLGPTATKADAIPLINGQVARVAVASIDNFGNAGVLSDLACATPSPIDDFYSVYKGDGGTAGCSTHRDAPIGGACALLSSSVFCILLGRRRARRQSASSKEVQ